MRILHVIDSLAAHGAERSLAAMLPELAKHGVSSTVAFLRTPDTLRGDIDSHDIDIIDVGSPDRRRSQQDAVASTIRSTQPDLVHTTLYRSDVAARPAAAALDTPVVSTWASTGPTHGGALLRAKRVRTTAIDRHTARHAVRFHAVSAPVATTVGRRLGVDPDRIDVIPRGRDVSRFGEPARRRGLELREHHGLGGGPLIVACARHEPAKGLDVLLDASTSLLARRADVTLVIAGAAGSETPRLDRIRRTHPHPERVRVLGEIDDVPALLSTATVSVVPSRVEGFPGTVVEAMLAGTPIVASDLPTIRAATGTPAPGMLVAPDDPDVLALAIERALDDPIPINEWAAAARRRAEERFSIAAIATRMVEFYERSLRDAGRTHTPRGGVR